MILTGNMVHCADLHGPAKPKDEAEIWSTRIQQEFLDQLKLEQTNNLPVTQFFLDIQKPKENCINEIFFHEKIVLPIWQTLSNFFKNSFEKQIENIKEN